MSRARRRERKEAREEEFENQTHAGLQQSMAQQRSQFTKQEVGREEYLNKLTEHGLDTNTAKYLKNMLSPDFVLSKITTAEKDEMRWLVRQQAEKIKAMHPPSSSPMKGEHRRAMYDDDSEEAELKPLTDHERQLLEMAVWDIFFRIARSVEGWQQKELSSQYNVSRVDKEDDSDSGRLGGLFS